MFKLNTRHFLTGEELTKGELAGLIDFACELKNERKAGRLRQELSGKTLIMLFEKPSMRTHMSFTVGMQESGGMVVDSFGANRKFEEPEDQARVLGGYCHGIVVRTFEHQLLERMASKSPVPIINGLSDSHHPCQILADIQTLKEAFTDLKGLKVAYIGDGNNILHSILLLMPLLGMHVHYSCPKGYEPHAFILKAAKARAKEGGGSIKAFPSPQAAVAGVNAIYTDVWTSMGFENEKSEREGAFEGYQVNEELYALAAPGAVLLHCLPMIRGKEITDTMADHENSVIFRQAENRLHAQKALLLALLTDATPQGRC